MNESKTGRCQHVTGWIQNHSDLDRLYIYIYAQTISRALIRRTRLGCNLMCCVVLCFVVLDCEVFLEQLCDVRVNHSESMVLPHFSFFTPSRREGDTYRKKKRKKKKIILRFAVKSINHILTMKLVHWSYWNKRLGIRGVRVNLSIVNMKM